MVYSSLVCLFIPSLSSCTGPCLLGPADGLTAHRDLIAISFFGMLFMRHLDPNPLLVTLKSLICVAFLRSDAFSVTFGVCNRHPHLPNPLRVEIQFCATFSLHRPNNGCLLAPA